MPRIRIVAAMALLLAALLLPQDVEAKKEKIGETLRFLSEERRSAGGDREKEAELRKRYQPLVDAMRRLVEEVAGPEPARQSALLDDLMAKYVPEESRLVRIASNERWATASLARIHTTQTMFKAADLDGDGKANYWVGDVSALYRLRAPGAPESRYIAVETARADARPALPLDQEGAPALDRLLRFIAAGAAQPSQGYLYLSLPTYEVPGGDPATFDLGGGRHPTRYAVCAYPAEPGSSGTLTFLRSESGVWKKDTGGKPPSSFPADPARAGWLPVE